jgi:hypothetical protein
MGNVTVKKAGGKIELTGALRSTEERHGLQTLFTGAFRSAAIAAVAGASILASGCASTSYPVYETPRYWGYNYYYYTPAPGYGYYVPGYEFVQPPLVYPRPFCGNRFFFRFGHRDFDDR